MTPLYTQCLNCKSEFDVSDNCRGYCTWHPGILSSHSLFNRLVLRQNVPGDKEVDHDSDFWADHYERCHGRYESFRDDPSYSEGITWTCCEKEGADEGCKSTKHKAAVNIISHTAPVHTPMEDTRVHNKGNNSYEDVIARAMKRRAEEEMTRPAYARCENCESKYDISNNTVRACRYQKRSNT